MATLIGPRVDVDMNENKNGPNGAAGDTQSDWLTTEQAAELEEKMFKLGKDKYGFDEATAREWAHAFCADDEDAHRVSGD